MKYPLEIKKNDINYARGFFFLLLVVRGKKMLREMYRLLLEKKNPKHMLTVSFCVHCAQNMFSQTSIYCKNAIDEITY